MNDFPSPNVQLANSSAISLHQFVDDHLKELQPSAIRKNSFFINDIPARHMVNPSLRELKNLVRQFMQIIISNTDHACMRITANWHRRVMLVHIRNIPVIDTANFESSINALQPLAEQLGGCITLNNDQKNRTTLVLSFTCNA